ncbi:MAG TPA: hypothetical protein VN253_23550 [Kofleriaceae bacterium]|nr:hypothetical protein [Kofleriaceae bacterium]
MRTRAELPTLTDRLPLGTSGLEVSPICLGITQDPRTIPAAFEAGINFFFLTADMHWPAYEATRRGLAQLIASRPEARDAIVVGAASYVAQPEFLWVPFQEVVRELPGIERLDLTIAGGSYGHEIDRRLETYERHRRVGHVGARAIGASFHDREAALRIVEQGALDIAFVRYSPCFPKARDDLFPHVTSRADGRRTLLFNFKSTYGHIATEAEYAALGIGADYWRPHPTDYYRFALTEPAIDGILCALDGPDMVAELADALAKGPLDEDDQQYLLDLGELVRGTARVDPASP